jgi:hypothetical protein
MSQLISAEARPVQPNVLRSLSHCRPAYACGKRSTTVNERPGQLAAAADAGKVGIAPPGFKALASAEADTATASGSVRSPG